MRVPGYMVTLAIIVGFLFFAINAFIFLAGHRMDKAWRVDAIDPPPDSDTTPSTGTDAPS